MYTIQIVSKQLVITGT